MFLNMAFLIEFSLLGAFAGFAYLAGLALGRRFEAGACPGRWALPLSGAVGILLGLLLAWLSHALLLVLFPNDRPFIQAGDVTNMGLLALAAYFGMSEHKADAA
jgi:hypothetical protein